MNADKSSSRESELSCLRWGSKALTTDILRWGSLWFVYRGWRVTVAGRDWKAPLGTAEKSDPLKHASTRLNDRWGPTLRFAFRRQGRGGPQRPSPQQGPPVHSKEREGEKHHLFRVFTVYCFYRALERKLIFYNFPLSIKEQANSRVFSFQNDEQYESLWFSSPLSMTDMIFLCSRRVMNISPQRACPFTVGWQEPNVDRRGQAILSVCLIRSHALKSFW